MPQHGAREQVPLCLLCTRVFLISARAPFLFACAIRPLFFVGAKYFGRMRLVHSTSCKSRSCFSVHSGMPLLQAQSKFLLANVEESHILNSLVHTREIHTLNSLYNTSDGWSQTKHRTILHEKSSRNFSLPDDNNTIDALDQATLHGSLSKNHQF